jgi:hypothetical protein
MLLCEFCAWAPVKAARFQMAASAKAPTVIRTVFLPISPSLSRGAGRSLGSTDSPDLGRILSSRQFESAERDGLFTDSS